MLLVKMRNHPQWPCMRQNPNRGHGNYKVQQPIQSRPKYQICERIENIAIDCYDRMNTAFEGRVLAKKLVAMVASPIVNNANSFT